MSHLESLILPGPVKSDPESVHGTIQEYFRSQDPLEIQKKELSESWYEEWVSYQKTHKIFARLLSIRQQSEEPRALSLFSLSKAQEIFGYYSPSHGYSLQVSFLGVFPIYMSKNEALKKEVLRRLEGGAFFAFGLSEKAHGSDIYSNEMTFEKIEHGYQARGAKYYIGNANCAEIITVLGRDGSCPLERNGKPNPDQFAFFALRPSESSAFTLRDRIRTFGVRRAYVGAFDLKDHTVATSDIISDGPLAWTSVFGTVNLGKFILGFGSLGVAERAFQEALDHLRGRTLYGKGVLEMAHLRTLVTMAFSRLCAMRLFAYRALDYVATASDSDRRYLLFCSIQKSKVSGEGVEVVRALSEAIGAKGFESDSPFESALRDIQLFPGLEGSSHINLGIAAQFMKNYFFGPTATLTSPRAQMKETAPETIENPHLFQAETGKLKEVVFPHFLDSFHDLKSCKNVAHFVVQIKHFRRFLFVSNLMKPDLGKETDFGIATAKCFATIVYGQLIAENLSEFEVDADLTSAIYHGLVEDLSIAACRLAQLPGLSLIQRTLLRRIIRNGEISKETLVSVYKKMGESFPHIKNK